MAQRAPSLLVSDIFHNCNSEVTSTGFNQIYPRAGLASVGGLGRAQPHRVSGVAIRPLGGTAASLTEGCNQYQVRTEIKGTQILGSLMGFNLWCLWIKSVTNQLLETFFRCLSISGWLLVGDTVRFPLCRRLWTLTKREGSEIFLCHIFWAHDFFNSLIRLTHLLKLCEFIFIRKIVKLVIVPSVKASRVRLCACNWHPPLTPLCRRNICKRRSWPKT